MTTISPTIRARGDGIPGLTAKGHTGQPFKMGDQSHQLHHLSIDRSSSAAGTPDLTVQESCLRFHIAKLRRILGDGQEGERYVMNVPGEATASLRG